jgi:hypothetical protein
MQQLLCEDVLDVLLLTRHSSIRTTLILQWAVKEALSLAVVCSLEHPMY